MGHGFCFEARQKRILIDEDYFFADLVFYHRILKCHVIVELKIDKFRHEYASQLNMYLNYFKAEVMLQNRSHVPFLTGSVAGCQEWLVPNQFLSPMHVHSTLRTPK